MPPEIIFLIVLMFSIIQIATWNDSYLYLRKVRSGKKPLNWKSRIAAAKMIPGVWIFDLTFQIACFVAKIFRIIGTFLFKAPGEFFRNLRFLWIKKPEEKKFSQGPYR